MKQEFDLIVIGAGTGGAGVARMAANAGWKTAIVDILPYGGTCALRGCDPKKMLVAVTEGVDWVQSMAGNGLSTDGVSVDWPEMIRFKRTFTDNMPPKMERGFQNAGITTLYGEAIFTSPETVEIDGSAFHSKHFHIATGARPATLGIVGEEYLITSTEFLDLLETPRRIAFVGGGFIAMEFAHISHRSGADEVTVLQRQNRPLTNFDPEMVQILTEATEEMGIDLRCSAVVRKIERSDAGLTLTYGTPDGERSVTCDIVVHAAGRTPNIDNLNLAALGVDHSRKGITVNSFMRSVSNPRVFAAGDCADSGPNLTPVSANEARIVGKNLLAGKDIREIIYPPIPSVVFTLPPVASVGLLEQAATNAGLNFTVHQKRTDGWYSSRRVGARHTGFKVLVNNDDGTIIGAHLAGPGAEEQINVFTTAMAAGLTANQIKALIFAYPSYSSDVSSMV